MKLNSKTLDILLTQARVKHPDKMLLHRALEVALRIVSEDETELQRGRVKRLTGGEEFFPDELDKKGNLR